MNQILSGVPVESLCLTSGILLSAKVMIHRYEYGRCFRMKMLGLLICLMSCLDFLIIYVHSELDTSRQMCARDKLIAKRIVQELIQQYQQLSSQKLSEQLNF